MAEDDLLICNTCSTQFDVPASSPLPGCKICDDPRQYVPPTGQAWTSLAEQKKRCHNVFSQLEPGIWSIHTEPQFGIGQRAFFLETDHGNILWDCVALLDDATIDWIHARGGLAAMAISHPHFYTTHLQWARVFGCRVHLSADEAEWFARADPDGRRALIPVAERARTLVPGVTAIKTGGHFPGMLVLHWARRLFVADALMITPSGLGPQPRPAGTTTFAFMWSYPNLIPLDPDAIRGIWTAIEPFEFEAAHGAFRGQDLRDPNVKARVRESMRIHVTKQGWASKLREWGWS